MYTDKVRALCTNITGSDKINWHREIKELTKELFRFVTSKAISRNELHTLFSKVLVYEKCGTNMAYGIRTQKATSDSARPSGNSPPEGTSYITWPNA